MSQAVHSMFSDIAPRYDLTNSVLSLGIHHLWRKRTVKVSGAKAGSSVLDCATGTGDLALEFKRTVGAQGRVLGTDFNADMLSHATAMEKGKGLDVTFEVADAMHLPYADATFDVASISFGIRNVDVPKTALAEMARVVKPGGRIVVLEFGQPRGIMGITYRFYSKHIIPLIGGLLTGNRKAYEYLPTTAAAFPCREQFTALMESTGRLTECTYEELTGGIAFLYSGVVK
jgi:demethylmenaquinone methyltransferase/2-methoxy-6-polyprenyl-1,4-benzoquinol methylase